MTDAPHTTDNTTGAAPTATELPLVSVVMPVHDNAPYLGEAVQSVLDQDYPRFELVAVDDGSNDDSLSILRDFAARDARVRVFANGDNRGIVATRNRAFEEASPDSPYFAILDSDDVCLPGRLRAQVAFLEAHPDHALVGGQTLIIDDQSRVTGRRDYPTDHHALMRVLTRYNPLAQPTVTLRRSALAAVGAYDPRYARCQDYDLWLRMAARFKLANLPEDTLKYRISRTQGKRQHLRETVKNTLAIQRRWLWHPRFRSARNTVYHAAQHGLLLLPESLVLGLFKAVTYRRTRGPDRQ